MRFWWVNHNQTARQEIGGGYLWAPKREASGARSRFYDNMRAASPGEKVLSYAAGVVGHMGLVTEFAAHAPKPSEFGNVGAYWGEDGWLLPVQWQKLTVPISPKTIIRDLGPLLPDSHSPIRRETGTGNQKAYFAAVDRAVHTLILSQPGVIFEPPGVTISISEVREKLADAADDEINRDPGLSETEKLQLTKARRGQGEFRERVCAVELRCRITGVENLFLLIASHIKPWRSCKTAAERLDGENGLLLAPHVDWLFDRGLLSFSDDGRALISSLLDPMDLDRLGLHVVAGMFTGEFSAAQRRYLAHHRDFVFLT